MVTESSKQTLWLQTLALPIWSPGEQITLLLCCCLTRLQNGSDDNFFGCEWGPRGLIRVKTLEYCLHSRRINNLAITDAYRVRARHCSKLWVTAVNSTRAPHSPGSGILAGGNAPVNTNEQEQFQIVSTAVKKIRWSTERRGASSGRAVLWSLPHSFLEDWPSLQDLCCAAWI